MSRSTSPTEDVLRLDSSLEALQQSTEFRGPVEPMDGDTCNDHFALIYENEAEQLAAAIPFLRQGLERDERCIYVVDGEERVSEIRRAMCEAGIDVDAALASDQLSFELVADTYLLNGAFDPDEMIDFYADAIDEATAAWDALRITAETSWLQDETTTLQDFMEYEAKVNRLFDAEDAIALCQYDRTAFEPEVVKDLVRTHPHLIYDGTVCHNFYHTPPAEFFGPEEPRREVDRMLGTLTDRTVVKAELQTRQRYLQRSYQITSNPSLTFDEKLERLLELGVEQFDLELGCLSSLSSSDDEFWLEKVVGRGDVPAEGPLPVQPDDGRFCRRTIGEETPIGIRDVRGTSWEADSVHRQLGITSYFGTKVSAGSRPYGTLWFGSTSPRAESFGDTERMFIELMGQWVSYELEREERERYLRRQNDVVSSPDRSFEEKLQELFELGCERLDLELGGMARVVPERDAFEMEYTSEEREYFQPGVTLPLSETYCAATTEFDDVVSVSASDGADLAEETAALVSDVPEDCGVGSYVGIHVEVQDAVDRTFFFVDEEPRSDGFTDDERTVVGLMAQWVKYELEQHHRERRLEETVDRLERSNERLEQFAHVASHDLQEPMRMVSSYLQLLEARSEAELSEDTLEYLEFAVGGADRMREMIEGLLQYSRVETDGDTFEAVELDCVLGEVLDDLQIAIADADADVTLESLPRVRGDGNQLRQVFQNVLENAIKYRGDGPPSIDVSAERRNREWVVSIADDGPGIDPEHQERIFDVFERLHGREEYSGTGVGLALCERIVERHGGTISVASEPGDGATFSVSLPAAN